METTVYRPPPEPPELPAGADPTPRWPAWYAFAGFAGRRLGWRVDPAQVAPLNDVVDGIAHLLRVLTRPGDGVLINPPVYHPFFRVIAEVGREVVEAPLRDGGDLEVEGVAVG